jgi:hypothetical protein
VPTIDLPADELAAVIAAIRCVIEDDRFRQWTSDEHRTRRPVPANLLASLGLSSPTPRSLA